MPSARTLWRLRPHTKVKHEILRRYLDAWFPILATTSSRLVYIDGFAGPGEYEGGEPGSPLLALRSASEHARRGKLDAEIAFIFIEKKPEVAKHLERVIGACERPARFEVRVRCGDCERELGAELDRVSSGTFQAAPTFAFLDPFGVKGTPFALVQRLLARPSTEVFVNCQARAAARCLRSRNPATQQRVVEQFGTRRVLGLASLATGLEGALMELYRKQLTEVAGARWTPPPFRIQGGPVGYALLFATNNPRGFVRMKEQMWRTDPSGAFEFVTEAPTGQERLFVPEPDLTALRRQIEERFSGHRARGAQVKAFVENETIFVNKHKRKVLAEMEDEGALRVVPAPARRTRRRRGDFPDTCVIEFR